MKISKIKIQGKKQIVVQSQSENEVIELKHSYVIEPTTRGLEDTHAIELDDDDVVEFGFSDNTVWYSSSHSMSEIFPEASNQKRALDDGFTIPLSLGGGDERGIGNDIKLKALSIFKRNSAGESVGVIARELAKQFEVKNLKNQIGLFRVDHAFQLITLEPTIKGGTYLLFLHGTASSTNGSFEDLCKPIDSKKITWDYITKTYDKNILALQHESLTKTPLENVLDLVRALPADATFDIISQSRGGLVGELFSRFCSGIGDNKGFTSAEINVLRNEYPSDFFEVYQRQINEISSIVKTKKFKIRRFIRSACPAHGTTLASSRLDTLVNVLVNGIGYITNWEDTKEFVALKKLAAAVVDCKNQVDILPGLEAMNPSSPFIKVLNNPSVGADAYLIDNSLCIISGNAKASFSLKGLLVIASKLFYKHKNDLIVDTASMYLGTRRGSIANKQLVQFCFDEGKEVNHFNYFKNGTKSNNNLQEALKTEWGKPINGFEELKESPINDMNRNVVLGALGAEIGEYSAQDVSGKKPIVVIIPGIMGSNLSVSNSLTWLSYMKVIKGDLSKLSITASNVTANSVIATSYKKLGTYLGSNYDVITFPFDWRKQLNTLTKDFAKKIDELLVYGQPIKVIAHSMGGVLVRDFMVTQSATWTKLNNSSGFKLLFLGSPLGGSFRIPAVLFGQDDIIDKLSKLDFKHNKKELLDIFTKFPGILSLLPLSTDSANDFAKLETWKTLAAGDSSWPLPTQDDLANFAAYRNGILTANANLNYKNAIYIAGKDKATPCGYDIKETKNAKELVFLKTGEGDQSVTWESGIPKKMIENNTVYYVNVSHGALANEPKLFSAFTELLEKGSTSLLSTTRPVVSNAEKLFRSLANYNFDTTTDSIENAILGSEPNESVEDTPLEKPIQVSVSLGDLRYASYPVLAGHFEGDGIVNAEKTIDECLNGLLSQRMQLNLYPSRINTNTTILTKNMDFQGAIIVGLGVQGSLTSFELSNTVEQGITRYLVDLNNDIVSKKVSGKQYSKIGISSLAIGSASGGLSFENSIRAIITGVQAANQKMTKFYGDNVRTIEYIEFIEQYEDKAIACLYSLSKIEAAETRTLNISSSDQKIRTLLGSKKRLIVQSGGNWWDRITVEQLQKDKIIRGTELKFSITTGGAREELRNLYINQDIVDDLFREISSDNRWTPEVAKTIFELLIPNDFKMHIKKQNNINWIVDENTAAYPWELLQDSANNAKPLCINAGMIRQLSTRNYRLNSSLVTNNKALIIADPNLNGFMYQLPGALKEGELVGGILVNRNFETKLKLNANSTDIIKSMFSDEYKIMHFAGHGVFDTDPEKPSGMLIGKNVFLTTKEIAQMSSVPEFVFVNCCYLGKMDGVAQTYYQDRYRLAANVGTQLIQNGVKAVIVAGWAVDDIAALNFTKKFYDSMFSGYTFGESVLRARQEIFTKNKGNNTWGAYQCYGDPFYKFDSEKKSKAPGLKFFIAEEAEMELNNLYNEIEMGKYSQNDYLKRLQLIAEAIESAGIRNAAITEKEALIYADMGMYDFAVVKFEQLFQQERASFSISTVERYYNIRAKKYVADFNAEKSKKTKGTETKTDWTKKMDEVISDLEGLSKLGNLAERNRLLGGAYKRKAMLCKTQEQKDKACKKAAEHFMQAHLNQQDSYSAYCLSNWFELMAPLVIAKKEKWNHKLKFSNKEFAIRSEVDALNMLGMLEKSMLSSSDNLDFWHLVAVANIKLCILILNHSIHELEWEELSNTFKQIWHKGRLRGKRLAEIEHLEFLLDALKQSKTSNSVKEIVLRIERLKAELGASL